MLLQVKAIEKLTFGVVRVERLGVLYGVAGLVTDPTTLPLPIVTTLHGFRADKAETDYSLLILDLGLSKVLLCGHCRLGLREWVLHG